MLAVISSQKIPTWNWDSLCTDDEANEELKDYNGPLCWHGFEADLGGFKTFRGCTKL